MGREVKRVAVGFEWPLRKVWSGYVNPHSAQSSTCSLCGGSGYSRRAKELQDRWYGNAPFSPADRQSAPWTPDTPEVRAFAERNVKSSPAYYGSGEGAIQKEAQRLCGVWNASWSHHLNQEDVDALIAEGRLMDFTHSWSREAGWQAIVPAQRPSADQVNRWSLSGFGHDSINCAVCVRAECERLEVETLCSACQGDGSIWRSDQGRIDYESWAPSDPPAGEAYQIWETVSEGSPVSPSFKDPRDLARWMAANGEGSDEGTSYAKWLAFIHGPGWAPSLVASHRGLESGVDWV